MEAREASIGCGTAAPLIEALSRMIAELETTGEAEWKVRGNGADEPGLSLRLVVEPSEHDWSEPLVDHREIG